MALSGFCRSKLHVGCRDFCFPPSAVMLRGTGLFSQFQFFMESRPDGGPISNPARFCWLRHVGTEAGVPTAHASRVPAKWTAHLCPALFVGCSLQSTTKVAHPPNVRYSLAADFAPARPNQREPCHVAWLMRPTRGSALPALEIAKMSNCQRLRSTHGPPKRTARIPVGSRAAVGPERPQSVDGTAVPWRATSSG